MRLWRLAIGATGTLLLVLWLVVLFWRPGEAVATNHGEAARSHSFVTRNVISGTEHRKVRTWANEKWSWDAPEEIRVGQSGRLRVSCKVESVAVSGTETPKDLDDAAKHGERFVLPAVDQPMVVSVQGPVEWAADQKLTTEPGQTNPLEWSWVFTAKEPDGKKLLMITLPARGATSLRRGARQKLGEARLLESRFIELPLSVLPALGVFGLPAWVISIITWFGGPVGGGLCGFWVRALWQRFQARRQAKREARNRILAP